MEKGLRKTPVAKAHANLLKHARRTGNPDDWKAVEESARGLSERAFAGQLLEQLREPEAVCLRSGLPANCDEGPSTPQKCDLCGRVGQPGG